MRPTLRLLAPAAAVFLVIATAVGLSAQQKPNFATDSEEQYRALAEAMKHVGYAISLQDGVLLGPGMQFLVRSSENSQFVLFGEEHNVKEFPEFLTALFAFLHQNHNFNYLALESDPVSAHVASLAPLRGDAQALAEYTKKYPNALTFRTDQELRMLADVGRLSTGRSDAIWGLDQSFGVLHALDRLALLPGFRTAPKFEELHRQAEQLDSSRLHEHSHYIEDLNLVSCNIGS